MHASSSESTRSRSLATAEALSRTFAAAAAADAASCFHMSLETSLLSTALFTAESNFLISLSSCYRLTHIVTQYAHSFMTDKHIEVIDLINKPQLTSPRSRKKTRGAVPPDADIINLVDDDDAAGEFRCML